MKRFIALVLVASVGLQAAGCNVSLPSPGVTAATTTTTTTYSAAQRTTAVSTDPNPNRVVPAPQPLLAASVPTNEALGSTTVGLLVGAALVGGLLLALHFASKTKDNSASAAPTPGGSPF